ncbi:MAG: hypothetical protein F6K07_32325, partial [Okeania sp. SIO1H5]|uniref:hypothetical protein n=1 Tax=Okeania sp. SIO1H5 TaxID=2607777 RepID=UPI0013B7E7BB
TITAAPVLFDVTGDQFPEAILGTTKGKVVVLNLLDKGKVMMQFPRNERGFSYSPLVGDFDKNGTPDIVAIDDAGMFHWYHAVPSRNRPGQELSHANVGRQTGEMVFVEDAETSGFVVPTRSGLKWFNPQTGIIKSWQQAKGSTLQGKPRLLRLQSGRPGILVADNWGILYLLELRQKGFFLLQDFQFQGTTSGKRLTSNPIHLADIDEDGILDVIALFGDGSREFVSMGGYAVESGFVLE